ncbi:hypothetical protein JQX13_14260 [Archangium violaceum]|uniref:hypothetical protein n=1 Tax=Archangium violaceum TaxID=83451 RepID=UPI00193C5C6B|nr:hypothetical protein [Archangium violaceum]QRK11126.1 hypothetical protein JQX13_14260 [Archangium violaceum]
MADKNWGNCKGCRYFGTHNAQPEDTDIAQCMEPDLREFDLQVSGMSGCNEFEARTGVTGGIYDEPVAPTMH